MSAQRRPSDEEHMLFYEELLREALAQKDELTAEVATLRAKSFDHVRAEMMRPYADRVFRFLLGYCAVVVGLILLDGFQVAGFGISDPVLGVIAGSTAVAAIGLVGFVVSGLFGGRPAAHLP